MFNVTLRLNLEFKAGSKHNTKLFLTKSHPFSRANFLYIM